MLTEMMNVVLEVDHRRQMGQRLDNLGDMLSNFSVVINDATPDWRVPGTLLPPLGLPPTLNVGGDGDRGEL